MRLGGEILHFAQDERRGAERISRRHLLGAGLATAALTTIGCSRARPGAATPNDAAIVATAAVAAAGVQAPTGLAQTGSASGQLATATPPPTPTLIPPMPTVTPTPRPPTPTPVVQGTPKELEIPKIGVSAPILGLGTDDSGELAAPATPDVVGWFIGGPRPGDPGNALLTGHLDWHTGVTGVFWRLRELQPGDQIYVQTDKERLPFVVESSNLYDRDRAPVDQILGFAIGRVITILTCEGKFIQSERDYTQRRVVRARLTIG